MSASCGSSIATPWPDGNGRGFGLAQPAMRKTRRKLKPWEDAKRMEIRRIREAHFRTLSGEPAPEIEDEPAVEIATAPKPMQVSIPDDYDRLPWSRPDEPGGITLRGLVKELGGAAINRDQALEVIAAAKERRG